MPDTSMKWINVLVIAALAGLLYLVLEVPGCDDATTTVPPMQYVEREVVRQVQVPVVRIQKERDTVIDIRIVKNTTDRYFLDKALLQIDSLRAVVRQYAAERGDTVERVYRADTLFCAAGRCDTLSMSFLALSERFMLDYRPSPVEVKLIERAMVVPVEVFPFSKKIEWMSYGTGLGAIGVLTIQALARGKE